MNVYLAGPLFTPYERAFLDDVAARLREAGHVVFVPHESALAQRDTRAAEIFAKDWAALADAEAVVALLDGDAVDDGTACEIGIFYALMRSDPAKRVILGLRTDMRADRGRELNLFVQGCIDAGGAVVRSVDEVLAMLRAG